MRNTIGFSVFEGVFSGLTHPWCNCVAPSPLVRGEEIGSTYPFAVAASPLVGEQGDGKHTPLVHCAAPSPLFRGEERDLKTLYLH